MIDPLKDFRIKIENYDIKRTASIYPDSSGTRWWTKAWFNDNEKGESSIEITRNLAIAFLHNKMNKDEWLSRFFPKQMTAIAKSIETTKNQLMGM